MAARTKRILVTALGTLTLMAGVALAGGGVNNGFFETGNLNGWQTIGGADTWAAYTDPDTLTRAAPRGVPGPGPGPGPAELPEPVEGNWAAGVSSGEPGTRLLLQKIHLPSGPSKLQFFIAHGTEAGRYFTPNTLTHIDQDIPNEQFRVDLMRTTAREKSMAKRDILLNLFRIRVGDPISQDWFKVQKWIPKDLRGRRVMLRFAEVDNQDEMMAAVDAVELLQPIEGRAR